MAGSSCRCVNGKMYEPDKDVCAKDLDKCEFKPPSGCQPCNCDNGKRSCSIAGSTCRCVDGKMYEPDRNVCAKDIEKCAYYYKASGRRTIFPTQGLVSHRRSFFRPAAFFSRCKTCDCGNGRRRCSIPGSSCRCVNGKVYEPDSDECTEDMEHCKFYGRSRRAQAKFRNPDVVLV
ncbi:latent-transforming growth factor beta-binding protein 3-like [Rhipicephalus sanguineus]|uniref:latent-transforming growth factor beta-binding protein 3-like n=1 Tax=Rhipicephalus sanguineus TaxID=34632 RepID=UPI0020C22CC5|nr:latent-transforming growth factor beta-binding protein 3-like [Rhipicephalus sanguineus]